MSLTVDEYKALVGTTTATDAAIELALAVAEAEINDAVGPPGDTTERIRGGHNIISLGRRASVVLGAWERVGIDLVELALTDYELAPGGLSMRRLNFGPHPSHAWRGQVEVTYVQYQGSETRDAIQAELVAVDLGDTYGATIGPRTFERIGEWEERYAATAVAQTPEARRASILARLSPNTLTFWVGSGASSAPGVQGS